LSEKLQRNLVNPRNDVDLLRAIRHYGLEYSSKLPEGYLSTGMVPRICASALGPSDSTCLTTPLKMGTMYRIWLMLKTGLIIFRCRRC
jgi:hypothetical protein